MTTRDDIITNLLEPGIGATEAMIQANIAALLTYGDLALTDEQVVEVEQPTNDGTRRRIDISVGHLVIEVKKNLRLAGILTDGTKQLGAYVKTLAARSNTVYAGVLTDGIRWHLFHANGDDLTEISRLDLTTVPDPGSRLTAWLESVLATQHKVAPTPQEIDRRLGAGSPAHALDSAMLTDLYLASASRPDVQIKRETVEPSAADRTRNELRGHRGAVHRPHASRAVLRNHRARRAQDRIGPQSSLTPR